MAQALSAGFCAFVAGFEYAGVSQSLNSDELWLAPVVQVVDIQQFAVDHEPSRFYLAVSDGKSLAWCVVPPTSVLEESIASLGVEIGCCMTLEKYVIVPAHNRRNVVVPIAATASLTPVSLIGQPRIDLQLAGSALPNRLSATTSVLSANTRFVTFTAFIEQGGLCNVFGGGSTFHGGGDDGGGDAFRRSGGSSTMAVRGRVLWKSKLRRAIGGTTAAAAAADSNTAFARGRFVFDAKVVDEDGVAMKVSFWGNTRRFDLVNVGECIALVDVSVHYSETMEPLSVQCGERATVEALTNVDSIPQQCARELGAPPVTFVDLRIVQQLSEIGDVVSVRGIVIRSPQCSSVTTKRGNVMRRTVTLRDFNGATTMDITLWDQHAEAADPLIGSVWCFCDVVVRVFAGAKVLSSRGSSEVHAQS